MNASYFGNLFMCASITLLFSLLVFAFILSIKNTNIYRNHIETKKWFWPACDTIIGTVVGLLAFFTFYLSSLSTSNMINSISVILILLPGCLYTSPYFALGGILPVVIGMTTLFVPTNVMIIYVVISYLIYLIVSFVFHYVLPKLTIFIKTILSQIAFILLQIILMVILNYVINIQPIELHNQLWATSTILQVFIAINWITCIYISKIYKKTQTMNHQVIHDYKYFITANYIYDEINEFIKDHNVQYAYIIGFSIKNIRKGPYTVSERIINGFKQSTADDIHHFFREKNEKLFFTSDEGYFFVLVKTNVLCTKNLKLSYFNNYQTERPKKDLISKFQDLIFSPFLYQGIQIKAETNLMVGIYGVHSNDIFYLIQSLQTMIEWFEPREDYNKVQLFDSKLEFVSNSDMEQFQQLKQVININDIRLKTTHIQYNETEIIVPVFSLMKLAAFNAGSIVKTTPNYLRPIMLKHLSAKALQWFSINNNNPSVKLMISYPLESLANFSFSAQMFYSKLSKLDIPAKQIILRLNLKYLPINYSDTNLSKNIQDLKKIGINIVCSYVNAHNIDFVSLISPYFVFYRKVNQENDKQKEYNILLKKLLAKSKVKYYSR